MGLIPMIFYCVINLVAFASEKVWALVGGQQLYV